MKKFKKLLILGLISVTSISSLAGETKTTFEIGATQIIEHPSLDLSRNGFETALKDKGVDVNIEFLNAQGDISTAQMIAKSFVDKKKALIFSISTPSSQAAYNATKDIPIVITAVTDPVAAGLIGENITGTSDPLPIADQIALIKEVLPEVKTIGLIYNTSEQNSVISVERAKAESDRVGLKYVERGVTSVNDIGPAMDTLLGQVDMIFLTTDNLIVSSISLVMDKANRANKPVFGSTEDQIPMGALITKTINFYEIGYRAGEMAAEILNGKDVSTIPIEEPKDNLIVVNKKVAEKYNINMNLEILKDAKIIE